jgi:hypothetical protein
MVITKNQIRPRRKKIHFTNAEILLLDTVGFIQLIPSDGIEPANECIAVDFIQIHTHIVQVYGNIDATNPNMVFFDDCCESVKFEDIATSSITNFTQLFGQVGDNLTNALFPQLDIDDSGTVNEVGPRFIVNWPNLNSGSLAGIQFQFDNGGADLNGGNVANFMDVFLDYKIINL